MGQHMHRIKDITHEKKQALSLIYLAVCKAKRSALRALRAERLPPK